MKRPSLQLAIEINRRVRHDDEWFEEADDLDRVERAIASTAEIDDPLRIAAVLAFRIAKTQGFTEGNKRTALLLARWVLDNNQLDGSRIIDPDDRRLAEFLVQAASGRDVQAAIVDYFIERDRPT